MHNQLFLNANKIGTVIITTWKAFLKSFLEYHFFCEGERQSNCSWKIQRTSSNVTDTNNKSVWRQVDESQGRWTQHDTEQKPKPTRKLMYVQQKNLACTGEKSCCQRNGCFEWDFLRVQRQTCQIARLSSVDLN